MAYELDDDDNEDFEDDGGPPQFVPQFDSESKLRDPKELREKLILALLANKPWSDVEVLKEWVYELEELVLEAGDDDIKFIPE